MQLNETRAESAAYWMAPRLNREGRPFQPREAAR